MAQVVLAHFETIVVQLNTLLLLKPPCSITILAVSLQWIMTSLITVRLPPKIDPVMYPVFLHLPQLKKLIKHLRNNTSPSPDGVPAEFYKATASFVSFPLSVIFNISIQTGDLPDIWKHACITPVFKKVSPSDPSNYRPISLTCIACKLIEMGIEDALMNHLLQHKLISHHQHMAF